MIEKYEAAELFVIGRAKDVILGVKDTIDDDNIPEPPNLRDSPLALFEE